MHCSVLLCVVSCVVLTLVLVREVIWQSRGSEVVELAGRRLLLITCRTLCKRRPVATYIYFFVFSYLQPTEEHMMCICVTLSSFFFLFFAGFWILVGFFVMDLWDPINISNY